MDIMQKCFMTIIVMTICNHNTSSCRQGLNAAIVQQACGKNWKPNNCFVCDQSQSLFENCIYAQFENKWCYWWGWNPKRSFIINELLMNPQKLHSHLSTEGGNFSPIHQSGGRMDRGMKVVWSLAKPFSIRPPTPYAEISAAATGNTRPRSQGQSQG